MLEYKALLNLFVFYNRCYVKYTLGETKWFGAIG